MKQTAPPAYIEELRLSGFRAFENARLKFDDLTVLVGHNGSGKSTLIDALEFVRDALSDSLENAVDRRGGFHALLHRRAKRQELSIAVKMRLPASLWTQWAFLQNPLFDFDADPLIEDAPLSPPKRALYGFCLVSRRGGLGFEVRNERMLFEDVTPRLTRPFRHMDATSFALRLPLIAEGHPLLRGLLEPLQRGIRAHNLSPIAIRAEPPVGRASILSRSGDNAGDVLHHLQRDKKNLNWIIRHLSAITPAISSIKARTAAGRRLIQFTQDRGKGLKSLFNIGDMSDGTLRSLAILLALRQEPTPALTCLEEIEDSVHPAALSVLLDAISASTERGQVLITSHSPEALSHPAVTPDRVRIVEWRNGRSQIFLPSPGAQEMSKPPRSVGTLLRTNALFPAKTPELFKGDIFEGL